MDETDDERQHQQEFRLRPSRNQKQRSKLKQVGEEAAPAEPVDDEPPPPPALSLPPPSKRVRLKRSGQMHDDLTAPLPDEASRDEPEY